MDTEPWSVQQLKSNARSHKQITQLISEFYVYNNSDVIMTRGSGLKLIANVIRKQD